MPKTRIPIPRSISDKVLKEYNHKCAICGTSNPQLHHIDEDPSNNDPHNLMPLCPNCHLIDQHNTAQKIDTGKLKLFRIHKDPSILSPQFHALFPRLQFMDSIKGDETASGLKELEDKSKELVDFIASINMGDFYSKQIHELVKRQHAFVAYTGRRGENEENAKLVAAANKRYLQHLQDRRYKVYELAIELLRFHEWYYESKA